MRVIFNELTPYKDRGLDYSKPVKIFRNLTRKGIVYSVQQKVGKAYKTVAHATALILENAEFKVSAAGREYVRKHKRKVVHAVVVGHTTDTGLDIKDDWRVKYNPYKDECFMGSFMDGAAYPIIGAKKVCFGPDGVKAEECVKMY